ATSVSGLGSHSNVTLEAARTREKEASGARMIVIHWRLLLRKVFRNSSIGLDRFGANLASSATFLRVGPVGRSACSCLLACGAAKLVSDPCANLSAGRKRHKNTPSLSPNARTVPSLSATREGQRRRAESAAVLTLAPPHVAATA